MRRSVQEEKVMLQMSDIQMAMSLARGNHLPNRADA